MACNIEHAQLYLDFYFQYKHDYGRTGLRDHLCKHHSVIRDSLKFNVLRCSACNCVMQLQRHSNDFAAQKAHMVKEILAVEGQNEFIEHVLEFHVLVDVKDL